MAGSRYAPDDDGPGPLLEPVYPLVPVRQLGQATPGHREVDGAVDVGDEVDVDPAGPRVCRRAEPSPGSDHPSPDEAPGPRTEDAWPGQQRDDPRWTASAGTSISRSSTLQTNAPSRVDDLPVEQSQRGVVASLHPWPCEARGRLSRVIAPPS